MDLLYLLSNTTDANVKITHDSSLMTGENRRIRRVRDTVPVMPVFENTKNILQRAHRRALLYKTILY